MNIRVGCVGQTCCLSKNFVMINVQLRLLRECGTAIKLNHITITEATQNSHGTKRTSNSIFFLHYW